jgi:hypothetical protein
MASVTKDILGKVGEEIEYHINVSRVIYGAQIECLCDSQDTFRDSVSFCVCPIIMNFNFNFCKFFKVSVSCSCSVGMLLLGVNGERYGHLLKHLDFLYYRSGRSV